MAMFRLTGMCSARFRISLLAVPGFRISLFAVPRFRISRVRSPRHVHEATASGRCSRTCPECAGTVHVSDGRTRTDSAVSLLAKARADNVHGMMDPTGPDTLPETVTLSHSPSPTMDDDAEPPASCRTIPSTAPASSPRASALAPARAASSSRSWVIPAADPASSSARRRRTAGNATANSAVTAPRSATRQRRNPCVMATPAPSGSGSAGSPGLRHCEG